MNHNLFDRWTEKSAYLLGVIAVLGTVEDDTMTVKAPDNDKDVWFELMAGLVGAPVENNTFVIKSQKILDALWAMKNKFGHMVSAVPEHHFADFAHGLLDAAGGEASEDQVVFRANLSILKHTRDRLHKLARTSEKSVIESEPNSIPRLTFKGNDVPLLNKFLYKGWRPEAVPEAVQKQVKEPEDVPCELPGAGSEGPVRSEVRIRSVRPRIRRGAKQDPMVW